MLTIITGTPGAGKTLYSLWLLEKEHRSGEADQERPIFVDGVADIDHEHFRSEDLEEPDKWYELPDGAVVFIDEGQRIFPQRPASQKVPKKCQEFATHRHKGMDIIITTQDASNIDAFIRRMCGRHFHVHRILGHDRATVYEFDHYESKPTGYHEKKQAISTKSWGYPKKLFDRYKSATLHTVKKKIPFKLYLGAAALVLMLLAIFKLYASFNERMDKAESEEAEVMEMVAQEGLFIPPGEDAFQFTRAAYFAGRQERVPGIMHSAAVYDDAFEVKTFPRPYCYIVKPNETWKHESRCKCLTQQMTTYQTDDKSCRYFALNGFFDPTKDEIYDDARARPGAEPGRAHTQSLSRDRALLRQLNR